MAEATAVGPKGALSRSGVLHPRFLVRHAFGAWMELLFALIRNGTNLVFPSPLSKRRGIHTTSAEGSLRSNLSF